VLEKNLILYWPLLGQQTGVSRSPIGKKSAPKPLLTFPRHFRSQVTGLSVNRPPSFCCSSVICLRLLVQVSLTAGLSVRPLLMQVYLSRPLLLQDYLSRLLLLLVYLCRHRLLLVYLCRHILLLVYLCRHILLLVHMCRHHLLQVYNCPSTIQCLHIYIGFFYLVYLSRLIYLCLSVYPGISHRFYICQGICPSVLSKASSDEVHLMQSPLYVCRPQSENLHTLEFTS
jgi:hypothetical protein